MGFNSFSQTSPPADNKNALKSLIESKTYHFHALSAKTMKGRTSTFTGEYFLDVVGDSISVDLPYAGKSYSVSYGSTDLSILFNTTKFTYAIDTTKKGGWEVTINPKNQPTATKIFMSIYDNGYCDMNVSSPNRQPISFYGNIEPIHKK
jgi:hypothetical protein